MRVLIVSPHFPPTNAADMQRVRMVLPHLGPQGVEAEVLAVDPRDVAAPIDPWLEEGLGPGVRVHRCRALGLGWSKIPGLGTLSNRAYRALNSAGRQLLSTGGFEMVYFSTTQFGLHVLGPRWKQEFGIPFTMDYQDPWVNDYYQRHPHIRPPGGRLKYGVSRWLSCRMEPYVLRQCSGITSVSPAYPFQLRERYKFLSDKWPVEVMGFPGDEGDLNRIKASAQIQQSVFDPQDGQIHWVYIGRGGPDMHQALRPLFLSVSRAMSMVPELARLKLHFVGTSYAPQGKGVSSVEALAGEYGLGEIVHERTSRIPYSEALRCLLDAHAILAVGSNDPGYSASKIYPYLLTEKPMLCIFHEASPVCELLHRVGGGRLVTFDESSRMDIVAEKIHEVWLSGEQYARPVALDRAAFEPYTARFQASKLTSFWACARDYDQQGRTTHFHSTGTDQTSKSK